MIIHCDCHLAHLLTTVHNYMYLLATVSYHDTRMYTDLYFSCKLQYDFVRTSFQNDMLMSAWCIRPTH